MISFDPAQNGGCFVTGRPMPKTPSLGHCNKNTCFWYILKQEEIRLQNCADVRKTLVTAASSWAWMFSNHVGRSFYRFVTLTPDGFSALPQPVQLGSILLLRFTNGPLCHCPRSQELR